MSNRTTLEALLARVLEGTGPDRELDGEIWRIAEPAAFAAQHGLDCKPWRYIGNGVWRDDSDPEGHNKAFAPPYTASLDAALTLVPEGWHWSVSGTVNREYHARIVPPAGSLKTFVGHWREAKSAPCALIAVCLKARIETQPFS